MPRILPPGLIRNLVMTKRQELRLMADYPQDTRWRVYLDTA
jgi:glutamine synthetase